MTPDQRDPVILAVDDDDAVLAALERILGRAGYKVLGVEHPERALELLDDLTPDLILLDVLMPGMSGYELCARIREREALEYVPVVFVTVLGRPEDRARAFAAGAADVVEKPFEVEEVVEVVTRHLEAQDRWCSLRDDQAREHRLFDPGAWGEFQEYLRRELDLAEEDRTTLESATPGELYELGGDLEIGPRTMARYVADFLSVPSVTGLDPGNVAPGLLPAPFCRANLVVPLEIEEGEGEEGGMVLVSNPFDWELLDTLRRTFWEKKEPVRVAVAEPDVIESFFTYGEGGGPGLVEAVGDQAGAPTLNADEEPEKDAEDWEQHRVIALANELLRRAVSERASDIHVEPKGDQAVIRFRVDGDLQDVRSVDRDRCRRLIARFKALGELDVAEKRKPQDGALEAVIHDRRFKLRLSTAPTTYGESLVVRLIEPFLSAPELEELGMSPEQAEKLRGFVGRSAGLLLMVGPAGSGKSTTIFSLVEEIEGSNRNVITVEDPVEYRIPFANQQQVNEKAGATFETLLRSAVRQDPDILIVGEIRDLFSAKAALDFASSGHLTLSTMHSANATTAVFRLERLGVQRGAMADAVLGVVAQKLLKQLCEECRQVRPITDEEAEWLRPFTDEVPDEVAEAVGCPACRETGYRGRTGVFEILAVDGEVARLVREGASIARIRRRVAERGDVLVARAAVDKVRSLTCSLAQVRERVLLEETERGPEGGPEGATEAATTAPAAGTQEGEETDAEKAALAPAEAEASSDGDGAGQVLVVEDDPEGQELIRRFLEGAGHDVVVAGDGAEALIHLGSERLDVVVSDINMPNLDGLKLIEIMTQKGLDIPVIFLTAESGTKTEVRGLELGAEDYLTKPVEKDVLRVRVKRVLERRRNG